MKKNLTPPSPYSYEREDTSAGTDFFFETDWEVRYVAHFSDYGYLFSSEEVGCKFYSFDLFPIGMFKPPKGTPEDARIAATIQQLFLKWFDSISNIIIVVYEDSDGSQQARLKKFESWFQGSDIDFIEKHNFEFADEANTRLVSLFVHADFTNKQRAIANFVSAITNGYVSL